MVGWLVRVENGQFNLLRTGQHKRCDFLCQEISKERVEDNAGRINYSNLGLI